MISLLIRNTEFLINDYFFIQYHTCDDDINWLYSAVLFISAACIWWKIAVDYIRKYQLKVFSQPQLIEAEWNIYVNVITYQCHALNAGFVIVCQKIDHRVSKIFAIQYHDINLTRKWWSDQSQTLISIQVMLLISRHLHLIHMGSNIISLYVPTWSYKVCGKMYITHKGVYQILAIGCNECNRPCNNHQFISQFIKIA